ncbi:MAG: cadherin-like domain-containing protein [Sphingobacterium sp.]|nr:cadherin-like domain-containing protein [Sphingobacterium sp.]
MTVPGEGVYTVDAAGALTFTPELNFNGICTPLDYTINDNTGATSNIATITISVSDSNDAPVAVNDVVTTTEDTEITLSVIANDTDADGTVDAAAVDLDPATAGIQTSFTVAGQGTYSVDATGVVTFTPALNYFEMQLRLITR